MRTRVEIENIEEIRCREGIDDVELREEIRGLQVGDLVRVTILNGSKWSETLPVRITSIHGATIRGKLTDSPTSAGLVTLQMGTLLSFTTGHIHSIPKMGSTSNQRCYVVHEPDSEVDC